MTALFSRRNRLAETIREELFPQGCALCGKPLYENAFYGLCSPCRKSLAIPPATWGRCSRCGQPLVSEQGNCLPCRNGEQRSFNKVVSLFPYMGKYQKILAAYKFGKRLALGNFFVEKLLKGKAMIEELNGTEFCWVPVPANAGKIKKTGWDQIEYLAKRLIKSGMAGGTGTASDAHGALPAINAAEGIRLARCLERLPSESQKELNRENRRQNLKGRIIVKKGFVPKTAVLFDDVYTTGATMDACASALKSGGAEKVYGICLCYD